MVLTPQSQQLQYRHRGKTNNDQRGHDIRMAILVSRFTARRQPCDVLETAAVGVLAPISSGSLLTSSAAVVVVETSWPPKSPRDALLSSPSGRKKYQEMLDRRQLQGSPLKRSSTAPNFLSRAEALGNDESEQQDDEDEDEETLQLKLAAIEARLKLKRLQRNRGQSVSTISENCEIDTPPRPSSSSSRGLTSRALDPRPRPASSRAANDRTHFNDVQVPVSPTKKSVPSTEPSSPRRYVLGIDKGLRGQDVSLKRRPSSRDAIGLNNDREQPERSAWRTNGLASSSGLSPADGSQKGTKSFSERITELRQSAKLKQERAERRGVSRSAAFQYDRTELETFKAAAAEAMKEPRPRSPARNRPQERFSREEILRSCQTNSAAMKRSGTDPSLGKGDTDFPASASWEFRPRSRRSDDREVQAPSRIDGSQNRSHVIAHERPKTASESPSDPSKFEAFSSLHLSSRILPHSFLTRTLNDKKVLLIPDLLKKVKAPDFELPEDVDGDFVVFGIVASKSAPKNVKETRNVTSKEEDPYDDGLANTSKYMALTLTDLKWTIDLFLFDTAFPRYYKLTEGAVIAILNPTIMPPPKHKLDTNRFSLAISSSDDKVLEIGFSRDIGFCKAVRKDGKVCQSWVDGRKTEFCDFHIDVQVRRAQSQRMGVNSGTGMFGPGGRSGPRTGFFGDGSKKKPGHGQKGLKSEGPRYDPLSQSVYYMAPAPKAPSGRPPFVASPFDPSAARLIDADQDDPFIAAGMMGRGMENREERLRRRLAEQQRERDITQKLVSSKSGGLGAEYLRTRTNKTHGISPRLNNAATSQEKTTGSVNAATAASDTLDLGGFRKADNVRLGPKKRTLDVDRLANGGGGSGVKKTRFITAAGIKEAGRDSLGGTSDSATGIMRANRDDDDDDDELDII